MPGKVIEIEVNENGKKFVIDYGAEKREVFESAIEVEKGDYVFVSHKVIVNKIPKEDVDKFVELLE